MTFFLAFFLGSIVLALVMRKASQRVLTVAMFFVTVGVICGYFFFNQI